MITKKVVGDKVLEHKIDSFLRKELGDVPIEKSSFEKTPLGEKITIHTSAPGLVIGRQGSNIKRLTELTRNSFGFKNPQIKIAEIKQPFLSANIVARMIANDLNRFGSQKFKLTGFKTLSNIMYNGAMGAEIRLTGKLPSSRAKSWRFAKGYLKKTGYVSDFLVDKAIESVTLKSGVVGIQVMIMKPNTPLPDKINYIEVKPEVEAVEKEIEEKAKPKKEEKVEKAESEVTEE